MNPMGNPGALATSFYKSSIFNVSSGEKAKKDAPTEAEDIEKLVDAINEPADPEDRELAMDILVGLAASNGHAGSLAQEALRSLYAFPGKHASENERADIRSKLQESAHHACKLFVGNDLDNAGQPRSEERPVEERHQLSITVAYLGGRYADSKGGNAMVDAMNAHIGRAIADGSGVREDDDEAFLKRDRLVGHSELAAASHDLTALCRHDAPLKYRVEEGNDGLVTRLDGLMAKMTDQDAPPCMVAWVNAAHNKYEHWMPLILFRDENDHVHCHLMDSDMNGNSGKDIRAGIEDAVGQAGMNFHLHGGSMQENAAHSCGILGHSLLMAMNDTLSEPGAGLRNDEQLSESINRFVTRWTECPPGDQEAIALIGRAELLEARAKIVL